MSNPTKQPIRNQSGPAEPSGSSDGTPALEELKRGFSAGYGLPMDTTAASFLQSAQSASSVNNANTASTSALTSPSTSRKTPQNTNSGWKKLTSISQPANASAGSIDSTANSKDAPIFRFASSSRGSASTPSTNRASITAPKQPLSSSNPNNANGGRPGEDTNNSVIQWFTGGGKGSGTDNTRRVPSDLVLLPEPAPVDGDEPISPPAPLASVSSSTSSQMSLRGRSTTEIILFQFYATVRAVRLRKLAAAFNRWRLVATSMHFSSSSSLHNLQSRLTPPRSSTPVHTHDSTSLTASITGLSDASADHKAVTEDISLPFPHPAVDVSASLLPVDEEAAAAPRVVSVDPAFFETLGLSGTIRQLTVGDSSDSGVDDNNSGGPLPLTSPGKLPPSRPSNMRTLSRHLSSASFSSIDSGSMFIPPAPLTPGPSIGRRPSGLHLSPLRFDNDTTEERHSLSAPNTPILQSRPTSPPIEPASQPVPGLHSHTSHSSQLNSLSSSDTDSKSAASSAPTVIASTNQTPLPSSGTPGPDRTAVDNTDAVSVASGISLSSAAKMLRVPAASPEHLPKLSPAAFFFKSTVRGMIAAQRFSSAQSPSTSSRRSNSTQIPGYVRSSSRSGATSPDAVSLSEANTVPRALNSDFSSVDHAPQPSSGVSSAGSSPVIEEGRGIPRDTLPGITRNISVTSGTSSTSSVPSHHAHQFPTVSVPLTKPDLDRKPSSASSSPIADQNAAASSPPNTMPNIPLEGYEHVRQCLVDYFLTCGVRVPLSTARKLYRLAHQRGLATVPTAPIMSSSPAPLPLDADDASDLQPKLIDRYPTIDYETCPVMEGWASLAFPDQFTFTSAPRTPSCHTAAITTAEGARLHATFLVFDVPLACPSYAEANPEPEEEAPTSPSPPPTAPQPLSSAPSRPRHNQNFFERQESDDFTDDAQSEQVDTEVSVAERQSSTESPSGPSPDTSDDDSDAITLRQNSLVPGRPKHTRTPSRVLLESLAAVVASPHTVASGDTTHRRQPSNFAPSQSTPSLFSTNRSAFESPARTSSKPVYTPSTPEPPSSSLTPASAVSKRSSLKSLTPNRPTRPSVTRKNDFGDIQVFSPFALGVVSHFPLHSVMQEVLTQLFVTALHQQFVSDRAHRHRRSRHHHDHSGCVSCVPIERLIFQLIHELPLPTPGTVCLDFGMTCSSRFDPNASDSYFVPPAILPLLQPHLERGQSLIESVISLIQSSSQGSSSSSSNRLSMHHHLSHHHRFLSTLPTTEPKPSKLDPASHLAQHLICGRIRVQLPPLRSPFCPSLPLSHLLEVLSVSNVMHVLGCMFYEGRILLHSHSLQRLGNVSQCFLQLFYPFTWPYTYIPVLPYRMLDVYLDTRPYLIGVSSQLHKEMTASSLVGVVIVDLDHDTLHCSEPLPKWPSSASGIWQSLNKLACQLVKNMDTPSVVQKASLLGDWEDPDVNPAKLDANIYNSLLKFYAQTLQGYRKYLVFIDEEPYFNVDGFLESQAAPSSAGQSASPTTGPRSNSIVSANSPAGIHPLSLPPTGAAVSNSFNNSGNNSYGSSGQPINRARTTQGPAKHDDLSPWPLARGSSITSDWADCSDEEEKERMERMGESSMSVSFLPFCEQLIRSAAFYMYLAEEIQGHLYHDYIATANSHILREIQKAEATSNPLRSVPIPLPPKPPASLLPFDPTSDSGAPFSNSLAGDVLENLAQEYRTPPALPRTYQPVGLGSQAFAGFEEHMMDPWAALVLLATPRRAKPTSLLSSDSTPLQRIEGYLAKVFSFQLAAHPVMHSAGGDKIDKSSTANSQNVAHILTQSELIDCAQCFQSAATRARAAAILTQPLSHQRRAPIICLPEPCFNSLLGLCARLLDACSAAADFTVGTCVMEASGRFFTRVKLASTKPPSRPSRGVQPTRPKYLLAEIKNHKFWRNMGYWKQALDDAVDSWDKQLPALPNPSPSPHPSLASPSPLPRSTSHANLANAEAWARRVRARQEFVVKWLVSAIHFMVDCGVELRSVRGAVDDMCMKQRVPNAERDSLQQFLDNLAKAVSMQDEPVTLRNPKKPASANPPPASKPVSVNPNTAIKLE